jgi:hypothetical protein
MYRQSKLVDLLSLSRMLRKLNLKINFAILAEALLATLPARNIVKNSDPPVLQVLTRELAEG